jgi:ABC-type multidrug transport system fused ATPase/permease subunit
MLYNKTISFLIKLTLSQKNLAIKSLFLATIVSILEGLSTPLVMIIIQTLGGGIPNNSTSSTTFTHTLYVFYQGYPKNLQLLVIIGIFLFLTIVKNISFYSSSISINDLQLKIGRSIRRSCIERFFQLELPFYSRSNLGELISYVNEQAQRTENLSSYIIELIRELLIISVLLVVLINLSPFLTITTLISLLIGFFILKNILKNVQYYGKKVAISIDEFSTFITEVLSGIRVIKSFSSEFRELERADRCLQNRYDAEIQAFGSRAAIVPLTETVGITVLLLILSVGSVILANKGSNSLPLLLTYSYTLLRLIPRINQLNNLRSQILLLSGSLESIYNFLSSTESLHLPDGEIAYKGLSARINFQDVTFTLSLIHI